MKEIAQKFLCDVEKMYIHFGEESSEFDDFINRRMFTEEAVKTFGLGYAPKGNIIYEYAEKNKLIGTALELGLIRSRNDKYYDFFRERIIIPIRDEEGRCIGFSGRSTYLEQIPKYITTANTPLFNRKKNLFGLDIAKDSILLKKSVIIVEGFMDMISLYDQGFSNTVALMGYQLTQTKIEKLKELTQNFFVMMDSDEAGKIACEKICKSLLQEGLNPSIIDISPFRDPDEFMNMSEYAQTHIRRILNKND